MQISVHDIGPVTEFEYELEAFGMHVLRGPQGAGKTTILRVVQLVTDGRTDVKPTRRDGTLCGEAVIAGKTIRISKTTRFDGELSVDGLGNLDIASLHTPKFAEAITRDKHRIKTLVRLAGVQANPALFYDLIGGKAAFDDIVGVGDTETDDLVEMAAKIKRAFEGRAIDFEGRSQTSTANRRAKLAIAEGVDLDAPHDPTELQDAAMEAAGVVSRLQQKREDATAVIERAERAVELLDSAEADTVSVEDANSRVESLLKELSAYEDMVSTAQRQLNEAEHKRDRAIEMHERAVEAAAAADRQDEILGMWRTDIEAAKSVSCPSEADIEEAEDQHEEATIAVTTGVRVRDAIQANSEANEYMVKSNAALDEAHRLRDAAKDTHEVLADAIARIPDCPLRVKVMDDGTTRLVIKTGRSESEPFDELSDGERWPVILQLASSSNRLIVLSQAAYGEFSPTTRELLHELAIENKCYILSAQADDGELRAGIYEAGGS